MNKMCVQCATIFTPKKRNQKFCCRKCVFIYKKPPGQVCSFCGDTFVDKKGNKNRVYCSLKCRSAQRAIDQKGKSLYADRPRVNKVCLNCDKLFSVSNYKKEVARYCSLQCRVAYKSKNPQVGERANNWIDGRSFLPYPSEFNSDLKYVIRLRDSFRCINCGKTEKEELIKRGKHLSVHHIDYCKDNCKTNNLVTTCHGCNVGANSNRPYWTSFFQNILSELYGYTYDEVAKSVS